MGHDTSSFFGGAPRTLGDETEVAATLLVEIVESLRSAGLLSTFLSRARMLEPDQEVRLATLHLFAYLNGVFGARQLAGQLQHDRLVERLWRGTPLGFRVLLDYRDRSNETLALFFTDVLVALADCGVDAFLHTPLATVAAAPPGTARARAAAELAVTLLNAAKRRDDIETARYGPDAAAADIPPELATAAGRAQRVQNMLRLRLQPESEWDQPTTLIDLAQFAGAAIGPLPGGYGTDTESAANEAARSGLLPRLTTGDWDASQKPAPARDWRPDVGASPAGGTQALRPPGPPKTGSMAALPPPVSVPTTLQGVRRPGGAPSASESALIQLQGSPRVPSQPQPRPRSGSSTGSRSSSAIAVPQTDSVAPSTAQTPRSSAPSFAARAGAVLMEHWQPVLWALIALVIGALAITFAQS